MKNELAIEVKYLLDGYKESGLSKEEFIQKTIKFFQTGSVSKEAVEIIVEILSSNE